MIDPKKNIIIAGPCSVESEEMIHFIAKSVSDLGIEYLRGGGFKPRTSPDSFQGMGLQGLKFLREAANANGLKTVSEIMDSTQLDEAYEFIDMIQIGSRNMDSYQLLKNIGNYTAADKKPVLLKRGFNSTLTELLFAAEYIQREGNPNVILCLRGIRTFEQIDSELRFTPDIASILELKQKTELPVVYDPSHSTGNRKYVPQISRAAMQLGADGLMIECHPDPDSALSDSGQAVLPDELKMIMNSIDSLS